PTQQRRRRRAPEASRLSSARQAAALNEVWTVDVKGWWRKAEQRCEPLTVRDEYSRYLLQVRAVEDARSETVRKSFERIFERHGLPQAIRSDNGSPFASRQGLFGLSRLSAWWVVLGIDLERGRPGHPKGLNQFGRSTTLPQHEFGRLVSRAQANRTGCDGSLVRPPPAGPAGFSDEKFYSGGYPPEKTANETEKV